MKDYAETAKAQASMGDPSSVTYALLAVCHRLDKLADTLEATGRESRPVDLAAPTDDDLGYPALRCGVYGSPAAAHWDDCERPADRDHWAPTGRINHGSTPTTCVHGQDHPDSLECEYACTATMPGHRCTRREHADDRHVWAMSDEEAERIMRAGQELGFVAEAGPLDESDHWPRHFPDGTHLYRNRCGRWHSWVSRACYLTHHGNSHTLAWWDSRLTFCDCDDATVEAENGATD